MRKADIARRINQQTGVSEQDAAKLLEEILELFKATLQKGESIIIHGFGKFTVRSKRPRNGRNPSTGEAMMILARRVVIFRPSASLTTEVNSFYAERHETVTRTR